MGHNGLYAKLHKTILASVWCIKPGILLGIAMLMSYYTPYEQILTERLRMRPGLPPYEMWRTPPDIGRLSVYFFNITNADRYLSGEEPKLKMDEIGPITFNEIWSYKDIKFNDNGTLTYTLKKTGIYDKTNNKINLNDTIVVFNFPLLLSASYLSNAMDITKFAFNNLVRILNLQPIVTMTIYDYLYNNKDAFLSGISTFLPSLIPFDNVGMANLLYWKPEDTVTMFIGEQHGHEKFSIIDKYAGSKFVPGFQDDCKVKLTNASECFMLHQHMKKNDVIYYLRKQLCRLIPIYYKETSSKYGLPAYLYQVKPTFLNRTYPEKDDCYKGSSNLPDGVSDMSTCWGGLPLVSSSPYFDHGDAKLRNKIQFNVTKPEPLPYILIEPITGVPFERNAFVQLNALVKPLTGFDKRFDRFNDTILPLAWIRCWSVEMPWSLLAMLYFVYIIYYMQWIVVCLLIYFSWRIIRNRSIKISDKLITPVN